MSRDPEFKSISNLFRSRKDNLGGLALLCWVTGLSFLFQSKWQIALVFFAGVLLCLWALGYRRLRNPRPNPDLKPESK